LEFVQQLLEIKPLPGELPSKFVLCQNPSLPVKVAVILVQ
jgi:hypothetical protein